ncbi:hypothetical protein EK21DRAFT_85356 [Setomelanomma holmii]|uniref:Uncharacterized protein n=1 Tax=Setomelanomma holmii TaxID=210430 RepID=A0A9P4HHU4_9PLEO|nr:hypothetical protein EK21DRAFT_85356 [Setomelanomma holmii]
MITASDAQPILTSANEGVRGALVTTSLITSKRKAHDKLELSQQCCLGSEEVANSFASYAYVSERAQDEYPRDIDLDDYFDEDELDVAYTAVLEEEAAVRAGAWHGSGAGMEQDFDENGELFQDYEDEYHNDNNHVNHDYDRGYIVMPTEDDVHFEKCILSSSVELSNRSFQKELCQSCRALLAKIGSGRANPAESLDGTLNYDLSIYRSHEEDTNILIVSLGGELERSLLTLHSTIDNKEWSPRIIDPAAIDYETLPHKFAQCRHGHTTCCLTKPGVPMSGFKVIDCFNTRTCRSVD